VKKAFPTLGVVGAYTGCVVCPVSAIHEVFDHLYPGIMTLGLAAMAEPAKTYLGATIPTLATLPAVTPENYQEVAALALAQFGPTMEVDGPIENIDVLQVELDYIKERRPDLPIIVIKPGTVSDGGST
jgi:hypothetical protein